jgi:hypothetical protein
MSFSKGQGEVGTGPAQLVRPGTLLTYTFLFAFTTRLLYASQHKVPSVPLGRNLGWPLILFPGNICLQDA